MHPKTLRFLITGLALAIFGPILGWVLTLLGFFRTMQTVSQGPLQLDPGQAISHMLLSFLPIVLGLLCGATGAFLVLFALAKHFLGQPPQPSPQAPPWAPPPLAHTPTPQPEDDDSRYMPKY